MAVPEVEQAPSTALRFRSAMARLPAGVSVVTTLDHGAPAGLTVSAGFSISLDPPTFGVSVGSTSRTLPALLRHGAFVVNVLRGDADDVGRLFASRAQDKFAGLPTEVTEHGLPWLPTSAVHGVVCDVDRTLAVGDHVILVGLVREVLTPTDPGPTSLAYAGHRFHVVES